MKTLFSLAWSTAVVGTFVWSFASILQENAWQFHLTALGVLWAIPYVILSLLVAGFLACIVGLVLSGGLS